MSTSPSIERISVVLRRTGLSRGTLYNRIADGSFPKPIPLGTPHIVGFLSSEIDEWINGLVKAARPESGAAA